MSLMAYFLPFKFVLFINPVKKCKPIDALISIIITIKEIADERL